MAFESPQEALGILGLDGSATREDIKSAYRRLAGIYHPDALEDDGKNDSEAFIKIQSAYEYLMDAYEKALNEYMNKEAYSVSSSNSAPKIIGNMGALKAQNANRHLAQERLKQERRLEKARLQRKKEVQKRLAEYEADMEYERAMREIHAIRAAEITLRLYEASLKGTIGKTKKDVDNQ